MLVPAARAPWWVLVAAITPVIVTVFPVAVVFVVLLVFMVTFFAEIGTVAVSLDARKRPVANQYEVITKFKVTSKNKVNGDVLFLLELEYGSTFHIEGVTDDQIHPFLLIECPRLMFPFVRRIISDVTRDGGFPPLNVDTVDFMALYRQELARRAQAQAASAAAPEKVN